jgi:hypothetical protein
MYLILMIIFASISIQNQLRMRRENLEIYSYTRYDFRYRKPKDDYKEVRLQDNDDMEDNDKSYFSQNS